MKLTGENRSTLEKTCPNATLSTTNPTWTDPALNPGLCGERPATNRLNHGTNYPYITADRDQLTVSSFEGEVPVREAYKVKL
jgi:hypothetical protein